MATRTATMTPVPILDLDKRRNEASIEIHECQEKETEL